MLVFESLACVRCCSDPKLLECFLIFAVGRTLIGSLGNNLYGAASPSVEAAARPSRCDAISQVNWFYCA
jgi:large subunit ribosomal protein L14